MTNEQAAYFAGAIDGEGWIGLRRLSPSSGEWRKSPSFKFAVTVANTNRAWLETLKGWAGGGSIYETEQQAHRNRRACYRLDLRGPQVRLVLAQTMPYLMMKRRQAELLLAFYPLAARRRALNGAARGADPSVVKQQEAIYLELRELNKRGHAAINVGGRPQSKRQCALDGCEGKHYGHGYCWIHYRKFIVRGGPALHERSCAECGKPFVARRSDAAFCSSECAGKTYYKVHGERIREQVAKRAREKRAVVKT